MLSSLFSEITTFYPEKVKRGVFITMTKYIKEIIAALIIATITGAFTKINYLEKEVSTLKQSSNITVTEVSSLKNTEKDVTLLKQFSENAAKDIQILKKSRESLSDYYVTRREFNSIIETQNKKIDMLNDKIEKLIDILMRK